MEKIKGYKTIGFAVLWIVIQLAGIIGFADYTPETDLAEMVNAAVGFLFVFLRLYTDTPAFKDE